MTKCAKCSKIVTKRKPGVQCNKCNKWYHGSCVSLSTEQLTALSSTDSIGWKCCSCTATTGGKTKRLSVILPDSEDEDTDAEGPSNVDGDKFMIDLRQEIRQLRQTVKEIIRDELQSTLKFYSNKIDEYEEKIKDYEIRVKLVKNQCKNLNNIYNNLNLKNAVLEQKINKLEQAQMHNDIEICGIVEKDNENVKQITASLCQSRNQNMEDVVSVFRKKKPKRQNNAQAECSKLDSPIIVSLRAGRRNDWIKAAKTTVITGKKLVGEGERAVFIREALTPTTAYLLWKTKTSIKETSICKFVWCKNGQVMVRKSEGDNKIYYISSENDIEKVIKECQKK